MDRITPLIIAASTIMYPAHAASLDQFQVPVKEAAQRFTIPAKWIEAVIMAESNGESKAVSHRGAMGLMQLMPGIWPGTWEELRERHGVSADVFDPRPNILAGTAWLKAMYERFDSLFAAYKAGQVENPGRYAAHLRDGKPLLAETRTYVAGTREAPGATPETTITKAKTRPSPAQNSPKIAFDTRLFLPVSTRENSENPARNGEFLVLLSSQKQHEK